MMPPKNINAWNEVFNDSDISEDEFYHEYPEIFETLLIDRTTNKNIIWGTDNYVTLDYKKYAPDAQITAELVTNQMNYLIKPRVEKAESDQKARTKSHAEVFTPSWVVKKQTDLVNDEFKHLELDDYINKTWLEITAGEAPYMVNRYDASTGQVIEVENRVGFLDRKLQRISTEINDESQFDEYVIKAYKASYGFEWNGDSLLLGRENLMYSYIDYFYTKFGKKPSEQQLKPITEIISYNLFQMDGLKYIIPLSEKVKKDVQVDLFGEEEVIEHITKGKRVKIMDWQNDEMIYFDSLLNGGNQ